MAAPTPNATDASNGGRGRTLSSVSSTGHAVINVADAGAPTSASIQAMAASVPASMTVASRNKRRGGRKQGLVVATGAALDGTPATPFNSPATSGPQRVTVTVPPAAATAASQAAAAAAASATTAATSTAAASTAGMAENNAGQAITSATEAARARRGSNATSGAASAVSLVPSLASNSSGARRPAGGLSSISSRRGRAEGLTQIAAQELQYRHQQEQQHRQQQQQEMLHSRRLARRFPSKLVAAHGFSSAATVGAAATHAVWQELQRGAGSREGSGASSGTGAVIADGDGGGEDGGSEPRARPSLALAPEHAVRGPAAMSSMPAPALAVADLGTASVVETQPSATHVPLTAPRASSPAAQNEAPGFARAQPPAQAPQQRGGPLPSPTGNAPFEAESSAEPVDFMLLLEPSATDSDAVLPLSSMSADSTAKWQLAGAAGQAWQHLPNSDDAVDAGPQGSTGRLPSTPLHLSSTAPFLAHATKAAAAATPGGIAPAPSAEGQHVPRFVLAEALRQLALAHAEMQRLRSPRSPHAGAAAAPSPPAGASPRPTPTGTLLQNHVRAVLPDAQAEHNIELQPQQQPSASQQAQPQVEPGKQPQSHAQLHPQQQSPPAASSPSSGAAVRSPHLGLAAAARSRLSPGSEDLLSIAAAAAAELGVTTAPKPSAAQLASSPTAGMSATAAALQELQLRAEAADRLAAHALADSEQQRARYADLRARLGGALAEAVAETAAAHADRVVRANGSLASARAAAAEHAARADAMATRAAVMAARVAALEAALAIRAAANATGTDGHAADTDTHAVQSKQTSNARPTGAGRIRSSSVVSGVSAEITPGLGASASGATGPSPTLVIPPASADVGRARTRSVSPTALRRRIKQQLTANAYQARTSLGGWRLRRFPAAVRRPGVEEAPAPPPPSISPTQMQHPKLPSMQQVVQRLQRPNFPSRLDALAQPEASSQPHEHLQQGNVAAVSHESNAPLQPTPIAPVDVNLLVPPLSTAKSVKEARSLRNAGPPLQARSPSVPRPRRNQRFSIGDGSEATSPPSPRAAQSLPAPSPQLPFPTRRMQARSAMAKLLVQFSSRIIARLAAARAFAVWRARAAAAQLADQSRACRELVEQTQELVAVHRALQHRTSELEASEAAATMLVDSAQEDLEAAMARLRAVEVERDQLARSLDTATAAATEARLKSAMDAAEVARLRGSLEAVRTEREVLADEVMHLRAGSRLLHATAGGSAVVSPASKAGSGSSAAASAPASPSPSNFSHSQQSEALIAAALRELQAERAALAAALADSQARVAALEAQVATTQERQDGRAEVSTADTAQPAASLEHTVKPHEHAAAHHVPVRARACSPSHGDGDVVSGGSSAHVATSTSAESPDAESMRATLQHLRAALRDVGAAVGLAVVPVVSTSLEELAAASAESEASGHAHSGEEVAGSTIIQTGTHGVPQSLSNRRAPPPVPGPRTVRVAPDTYFAAGTGSPPPAASVAAVPVHSEPSPPAPAEPAVPTVEQVQPNAHSQSQPQSQSPSRLASVLNLSAAASMSPSSSSSALRSELAPLRESLAGLQHELQVRGLGSGLP